MWRHAAILATLVSISLAGNARAAKPKIAVLPTQLEGKAKGAVPKLFDDYVLTAVQNAGDFEVIGQDDISSMLGFEKQKDMLGCDDMSCMADIGGALGVERLVVIKIARLEDDWVSTAKLINIQDAKVESRSSDFVPGDVKALLQAVPNIINKLFAGGGDAKVADSTSTPKAGVIAPTPSTPTTPGPAAGSYDASYGRGARTWGLILSITGFVLSGIGALVAIFALPEAGDYYDDNGNYCDEDDVSYDTGIPCDFEPDWGSAIAIESVYTTGLILAGAGSGLYLNGKARATLGDAGADGQYGLTWLGWTLTAVAFVGPLLGLAMDSDLIGYTTGIGGIAGAVTVFAMSMGSSSTVAVGSDGRRKPIAHLMMLRDGERTVPGIGFTFQF